MMNGKACIRTSFLRRVELNEAVFMRREYYSLVLSLSLFSCSPHLPFAMSHDAHDGTCMLGR